MTTTINRLRETATTRTDRAIHRAITLLVVVVAVLVGVLIDRAEGGAVGTIDLTAATIDGETETEVSSSLLFSVVIPNEPEDGSRLLATALRTLGATADCPGECLLLEDAAGNLIAFRFSP